MASAVVIACALSVAGVASSAVSTTPASADSGPCQQTPVPGNTRISLTSGGITRTALVHVPPAPAGQGLPLLIGLHGAGGGFFEHYSGFSLIADAEDFIAVYPDPTQLDGRGFWNINDHYPAQPDDVRFIADLLDQVQSMLCVDPTRVYAAGVSNGGGMAARLACQLSSRFAAIASIAGGYGSQPPCQPLNPVSVIEVHGTSDQSVPYRGGAGGMGAVRPWMDAWARRDGCLDQPRTSRVAARVLRYAWPGCSEGAAVEHLQITGGAHQLPGGLPRDAGPVSTISAPWLVWTFLSAHRLAAPYPTPPAVAPAAAPARRQRAAVTCAIHARRGKCRRRSGP